MAVLTEKKTNNIDHLLFKQLLLMHAVKQENQISININLTRDQYKKMDMRG